MQDITYRLENFEGPLDLLLHLIEKNKIDIYDIPIIEITRQYLEFLEHAETKDLDIMSNFLVMASTLLEIKSRMLLPLVKDENGEEIDPRSELVARLLEHKKYKDLGYTLSDYEEEAPDYMLKRPTIPKEVKDYIPEINYDELLQGVDVGRLNQIFIEILNRKENSIDEIRSKFGTIQKEKLPLKDYIMFVMEDVRVNKKISFRKMLDDKRTKSEVIVTFLAVLELMKMGKIKISQDGQFGDINVEEISNDNKGFDFSNLEDE